MNIAPGLPQEWPRGDGSAFSGVSPDTRSRNHNLPDSLTTFIGREAERSMLIDLLRRQQVRLVTLTGPGGIGKTRLATEIAREVAPAFRDGVRFVPVESIADPELGKLAMAQAIGLPRSVRDVETAIIDELAGKHTLLLVDNFEQIVSAAPFFTRLLVAGPDIKMLITSRIPLRVSGEHVYETQPLSLPESTADDASGSEAQSEAVRLFIARARAANPQLSLDTASIIAISRICERLDGFPLAIELAAARSNLLKPEAILQRLEHRLALLTTGARDQPRRLQSLRDAIGWSYDLLDADEQRLFRAICVFAGGFSLEALEAVAGSEMRPSVDILEVLSALIDSSLVRRDAPQAHRNRYVMYETIREFGLDMLRQQDELDAIQARHAAYFVALAEQIFNLTMSTEPGMLDRLDDDQSNFREALAGLFDLGDWDRVLELSGNLSWYWFQRGRVLEGRRWLHRAVGEAAGDVNPLSRRLAVLGLGLLAQASGDVASAQDLFEQAALLANDTGDQLQLAIATGLLAGALTTLGQYERAAQLFAENERRWDAERKPTWMGHAYFHLGLIALGNNQEADAAAWFTASVVAYDDGNSPLYAVDALQYLGLVELRRGNPREAGQAFGDALNRLELRKSAPDLAMGIANVAALAARLNRPAESVALFAAARAARDAEGLALPEPASSLYESFVTSARSALSPATASEAVASGERMSLDAALDIARAVLTGGDVMLSDGQEQGDRFGLTEREFDVLRLLGNGKTNDEIARALFISNGTARTHVANILGKLDAHTRTEAAGIARRHGLI